MVRQAHDSDRNSALDSRRALPANLAAVRRRAVTWDAAMLFDLSDYHRLAVKPLAGGIGAEIDGADLSALDDEQFAEIHRAFLRHHAIFFRDQALSPEAFERFAARFAPPCLSPYANPLPGVEAVTRLVREADAPASRRNIGDRWHADQSPRERPNMGAALYCLEAPPYGGDTLFANLCLAYEALDAETRALCDGLVAIHSPSGVFGLDGAGGGGGGRKPLDTGPDGKPLDAEILAMLARRTEHPLVRIHPESGRRILYVTGDYMVGLKGMADAEAMALLERLNRHAVRPEFTCRWRWRAGSLAVWDNRCTQHYAVNDYAGFRREMLRVEMEGERPFGPAMPRPAATVEG